MSHKKNNSMLQNGICLSDNQSDNSSNVNNTSSIQNENALLQKEIEKQSKSIAELLKQIAYYKDEILKFKNHLISLNTKDILYQNEELNQLELERLSNELIQAKELNTILKKKNKSLLSHNLLMKENVKFIP